MEYVANPVAVQAYRITEIRPVQNHYGALALSLDNNEIKVATPEMLSRIDIKIGDYWVIQSDGYEYLNPADVFERKYSPR